MPQAGLEVGERAAFSSARKWSGGVVSGQAWLLGAPDVLLAATTPDPALADRVHELSDAGRRVLLLARADALPATDEQPTGVRAAAVVELAELVRDDARQTLDYFRDQGVRVIVISGDTPRTVAAVGREVGLDVGEPVDARTLPEDQEQLADIVERTTVFGRVTPGQKRSLVRALQSRGHVVAMTGDGVNDVLALKDADIGIAMGNGAQATKAVAQLVLLDSKFSHLPSVLAEGRRLIGNVERVASLFVTKNVMSAVSILAAAFFGLAYPFLPSQLTLVSTLTIGIPAAILALGPNTRRYEPGFLRRVLAISVPGRRHRRGQRVRRVQRARTWPGHRPARLDGRDHRPAGHELLAPRLSREAVPVVEGRRHRGDGRPRRARVPAPDRPVVLRPRA